MATSDTTTNLASALTSSISPLGPKIRLSPDSGLSRSVLKERASGLKDQPPSISGVNRATATISSRNGVRVQSALTAASVKRSSRLAVSSISLRDRLKPLLINCINSPIMKEPSINRPAEPAIITVMLLSSRERGTCPCCCASRSFLGVGCSVFS